MEHERGWRMAGETVRELCAWGMKAAFARGKGLEADSLLDALHGLTARQAAWQPEVGGPSIWEIVDHVAHWKEAVLRISRGEGRPETEEWLVPARVDKSTWATTVERLESLEHQLEQQVAEMTDEQLEGSPEAESEWNWAQWLIGLVAHDAYHTGQIAKLRQLQNV
jgi:uncharacterized damage-inducible protein DinB